MPVCCMLKKRKGKWPLGWDGGGEGGGGNFSKNRKACVVLAHTTNKTSCPGHAGPCKMTISHLSSG